MEGGGGVIGRQCIKQRKENLRKPRTGFLLKCGLLAALLFLFTAVAPLSKTAVFSLCGEQEAPPSAAAYPLSDAEKMAADRTYGRTLQMLSAPFAVQPQQTTVRENFNSGFIELLRQRVAFCYRYLQQIRLFVWHMITGLLLFAALQAVCCEGKRRQRELVWRSLWIVRYRNRADGKKEGIAFFIKIKNNFFMGKGKKKWILLSGL